MPKTPKPSQKVRFGVFEVDLRAGELHKNGRKVRLQEQPFQVLTLLLEQPGELVTREELQQKLWPDDTFVDFDHGLHNAINKVREALGDAANNPRFVETMPRRGYRFISPVERLDAVEEARAATPPESRSNPKPWGKIAAVGAALVVMLAYLLWPQPEPKPLTFTERALTYTPGQERNPSFSPDGTRVTYDWDGGAGESRDIYIKLVEAGSGEPTRVTADPREDVAPAWSPDGTKIVFARFLEIRRPPLASRFQLVLVSPVENSREQVLDEFETRGQQVFPSWSPDGKHIVFSCRLEAPASLKQLCLYSLETGEARPLTFPTGTVGDGEAVFSWDGRAVAYVGSGQLYVLTLSEDMRPQGEPRVIVASFRFPQPAGWTRDGKGLYFLGRSPKREYGLWVVDMAPGASPQLLRPGSVTSFLNALRPELWLGPSGGMRLAYVEDLRDSEIMRVDLTQEPPGRPTPLLRASGLQFNPQFSPDGSRVAFMSYRAGVHGIWMCERDGSNPELLIELAPFAGFSHPDWSPDGSRITLDAIFRTGARDVYIVDVASKRAGPNLTLGGGRFPSWSRGGKSIYYTAGDTSAIWKLDVQSGEKELLLEKYGNGRIAESLDSRTLYFQHGTDLMKAPLGQDGRVVGEPQTIADQMVSFSVVKRGVYLMTQSGAVFFYEEKSGEVTPLIETGMQPPRPYQQNGISVSHDEGWLVYTHWKPTESDLKLLESVE